MDSEQRVNLQQVKLYIPCRAHIEPEQQLRIRQIMNKDLEPYLTVQRFEMRLMGHWLNRVVRAAAPDLSTLNCDYDMATGETTFCRRLFPAAPTTIQLLSSQARRICLDERQRSFSHSKLEAGYEAVPAWKDWVGVGVGVARKARRGIALSFHSTLSHGPRLARYVLPPPMLCTL